MANAANQPRSFLPSLLMPLLDEAAIAADNAGKIFFSN
jgi:hypothetical protein